MEVDSNHRSKYAADLQSVPFGHSGIHPYKTNHLSYRFRSVLSIVQADDRTRTDNLLITNQLLCQLSHIGKSVAADLRAKPENGAYRTRTCDPLLVRQMLSQLS